MSFGEDVATLVSESKDPLLAAADGWERIPLGAVATILNGFPWKSEHFGKSTGVPLIRIRDVTTGATETLYEGPITDGYWVEPGDLLVGMDGDFNVRRWQTERGLLNQRVCKVTADPDRYSTTFLEYVLPSYLQLVNHMTSSVTVKHLSSRTLADLPLPLPPAAEQRRIVAKLDALTARLARARAELDRVQVLAQSLRLKAIRATFASYAGAPRHRVDALCSVGTGATPKRGESRYYGGGKIPWVTSGAVNSGNVMTPTELITEAAIKETNCKVYPAGSLIMALYGEGKTRGKVATLGINAATNQALAVLHSFAAEIVETEWIKLFLDARYEETRAEAAGGVQPNLNLGIVKSIQISVPSLDAQRSSIVALGAAFTRADRLEAEAARARALLDRLESAILAKAFRGELVPQDPNDEPASVLLDRIRAQRAAAPKPKRSKVRPQPEPAA